MSLELSCESIEIRLLEGQADLSGFHIKNEDTDSHSNKDRIIVKALPREPDLTNFNGVTVKAWRVPVEVTVHFATVDASAFDAKIAAVEAANAGTPAAAAVTLATSTFPNGMKIFDTDDGAREQEEHSRARRKVFNFLIIA